MGDFFRGFIDQVHKEPGIYVGMLVVVALVSVGLFLLVNLLLLDVAPTGPGATWQATKSDARVP